MRRSIALAGLLFSLAGGFSARAADLGASLLPISLGALPACEGPCALTLEGDVSAAAPVTVVLRIDDAASSDYASRFNGEHILPPGAFRWQVPLDGLRATGGRALERAAIRKVMLFLGAGSGQVRLARFSLDPLPRLPEGARGFSLGATDAPPVAGFERIAPGDARLAGPRIVAIRRPAPDPLIANGLIGVERLHLPWPKGRVRLSLWSEDPGEWETLPHPLERRIRVNGKDVLHYRLTPDDWLRTRYLAGATREAGPTSDAYEAFGQYRGNLVSVEIPVDDGGIRIELAGESAAATFLSAVLVEPAESRAALDQVLAARRQWYRDAWPVGPPRATQAAAHRALALGETATEPLRLTLAPGAGQRVSVSIASAREIETPDAILEPPARDGVALGLRLWAAQRQLDRMSANANLLGLQDNRLRARLNAFPIRADAPRRYEIWIDAPEGAKPGLYKGGVALGDTVERATLPIEVEILPVRLPEPDAPAGFYLDEAPHLTWFRWPDDVRRRQLACDLELLQSLGVTGNAPAFSTPDLANRNADFHADAQLALQFATRTPWLAYAPAKRAIAALGLARAGKALADIDAALHEKGLPPILWSVADEPGNPDGSGGPLPDLVARLREAHPRIRLAAQLNRPQDRSLAPLFDTVLVNPGYGIDVGSIAAIAENRREAWLYNTDKPRFTAGLWLWRSGARRYLQWHARMPTADPFDPTDGREGDVQMILPQPVTCPRQPDIHADMLAMAEGLVDQRWLLWLDSKEEAEARALAQRLRARLGTAFSTAAGLDDAAISGIRAQIVDLARRLN